MIEKAEKFLTFNGKTIVFQAKDGMWWIALKPICDGYRLLVGWGS
jgi:hypothetical protein